MAHEEPNRKKPKIREAYTAFDRALIKAAQDGTVVEITLADGTTVNGLVKSVDRYQIQLEIEGRYHPYFIWYNKSLIMSTKIGK